ncbi:MAG: hypothetical protein A2293_02830 [Elusimicrobia bacterium RIFOXYB2_FULL_49_7]|nr:MAG: hypothetical protein A2293_02830 [Elusimicrobia bacterium RIFOXYB2_FULL_49_7]
MMIRFLEPYLTFFNEMAIYLIAGFVVAGLLHLFFPESFIRKHLGNNSMASVLKSTFFGIPLPLCSCGVVPVAASLRKSGASRGATAAFLTSTPQIGADSFLISYSFLGGFFALFRVAASFLTALSVGWAVNLAHRAEPPASSMMKPAALSPAVATGHVSIMTRLKGLFNYIQYQLLGSLANSLVLGVVIAGLIAILIPEEWFTRYLDNSFLSMLLMLVVGIPMYVCASASTPIAAALVYKGLSPGAALVFLLTGPATNAVTVTAVFRMLGKKAGAVYLAGIAVVALILGGLTDLLMIRIGVNVMSLHHHSSMLPEWLKVTGSVVLLAMLLRHYVGFRMNRSIHHAHEATSEREFSLQVTGMTCLHCAARIKQAVETLPGLSHIRVNLKEKRLSFQKEGALPLETVMEAVRQAGYGVHEEG